MSAISLGYDSDRYKLLGFGLSAALSGLAGATNGLVSQLAVLAKANNYLAQLGAWVTIVQGAIFVLCVLMFRRGIMGELARWLKKPL